MSTLFPPISAVPSNSQTETPRAKHYYIPLKAQSNVASTSFDIYNQSDFPPNDLLVAWAKTGNLDGVRLAFGKNADINTKLQKANGSCGLYQADVEFTPLLMAAKHGRTEVLRFLIAQGAQVNVAGPDSNRALHFAVANNDLEAVRLLLDAGADINATGKDGFTPLHTAIKHGHVAMAEFLLKAKANPIIFNEFGYDCVSFCRDNRSAEMTRLLETHVPQPPPEVGLVRTLKAVGLFLGYRGKIAVNKQPVYMMDGPSPHERAALKSSLEHFKKTQAADTREVQVIDQILSHMRFHELTDVTNPEGFGAARPTKIRERFEGLQNGTAVFDLSWKGHAVYAAYTRNPESREHPHVLAILQRGGGTAKLYHDALEAETDPRNPLLINAAFILNLGGAHGENIDSDGNLKRETRDEIVKLLTDIKYVEHDAAVEKVYDELTKKYPKVPKGALPLLTIPQLTQPTGNCPAASLEAMMYYLCRVGMGDVQAGDRLYEKLRFANLAHLYVETLKQAEDAEAFHKSEHAKYFSAIFDAYKPEWEEFVSTIEGKSLAGYFRKVLRELADESDSLAHYPKTKTALAWLVARMP